MRTIGRIGILTVLLLAMITTPASAHGELIDSSPKPGSVVGGEFHGILLLFTGMNEDVMPTIELTGPIGVEVESTAPTRDRQQIVLPIDPLTAPGTYTLSYSGLSGDNDLISGSFTFGYEPSADEPGGLTLAQPGDFDRYDKVAWGLLAVGAGLAGFLVHRVWFAIKTRPLHVADDDPEEDLDEAEAEVEELVES